MTSQSADSGSAAWPKAVLFDLDGTLIDSAPDIAAAVNDLLSRHGHAALSVDQVRGMIGNGVRKLVERAFAARDVILDESALDQRHDEMMGVYGDYLTVHTVVMPETERLLGALKARGVKIAIVTNKPERFTCEIIAHYGWDVDCIVGGDSLPTRKPDPAMLQHACTACGVTVSEAVMVGDSPADIDSALAAPMRSVAVRGGYTNVPVEKLGADRVIDSLADLENVLATMA